MRQIKIFVFCFLTLVVASSSLAYTQNDRFSFSFDYNSHSAGDVEFFTAGDVNGLWTGFEPGRLAVVRIGTYVGYIYDWPVNDLINHVTVTYDPDYYLGFRFFVNGQRFVAQQTAWSGRLDPFDISPGSVVSDFLVGSVNFYDSTLGLSEILAEYQDPVGFSFNYFLTQIVDFVSEPVFVFALIIIIATVALFSLRKLIFIANRT